MAAFFQSDKVTVQCWASGDLLSQFSTGMAGLLLPIFFICLRNQLSSIHSIVSTDV